jgi:CubicO group peptidase (beta-lactamase class C family)
MGRRFLLICLALSALARVAFAQPADDTGGAFGGTVLEAPPREQSGPIVSADPAQLPSGTFDPEAAAAEAEANMAPETARLKAHVDGLMTGLIAAGEFPGAALLIIQDGKVVIKSGYGFADVRARVPVDPNRTRFRVASISKLVTATAVMQLVEQGKVDLNADVNAYLQTFKIPAAFPEPVTLAKILTHTAGFDDRYVALGTPLSGAPLPLGQYLAHNMPPRVHAPGKIISYSNHALALAGHVVENVSGEEFGAYVQTNIFTPLGMESSSFGIPYPTPQDIAVPYYKGGNEGGFRRIELDRVQAAPAGDLVTTAADIAKFMTVHLNKGVYGDDEKLLTETTIDRMHAEQVAPAPGLDGWGYGFMEGNRNGVRWIGHDGSWLGFCAQLVMVPETKSAFFFAYNADCHFAASGALRKALFNALWPSKVEIAAVPAPDAEARAQSLAGTYMTVRRARADFTAIAAAASQMTVKAPGDGVLLVNWPMVGHELTFLPQADGTWINPDYQLKAAAVTGAMRLAIEADVFDRVAGSNDWAIWSTAMGVVVLVCVIALWNWITGALSRQFLGEPTTVLKFWPRFTAFVAAGLVLVFLVTMASLLAEPAPLAVIHGPTPMLTAMLAMPVVVAALALPMMYWSAMGFGDGTRARLAQVGYAVLTIAILVFVAFAWQWGLTPFTLTR